MDNDRTVCERTAGGVSADARGAGSATDQRARLAAARAALAKYLEANRGRRCGRRGQRGRRRRR